MNKPPPLTEVIFNGAACSVEAAVLSSGKSLALLSLAEFEEIRLKGKDKPEANAKAKFMFLFQEMSNSGRLSPKRFDSEMDGLFAFKSEFRNLLLRMVCFRDGRKWILTHGFQKPGAQKKRGKWPDEQIQRAKDVRSDYFSRKKSVERENQ